MCALEMKTLLIICGSLLAVVCSALAGFDVPKSIYTMKDLEEAKAKAAEKSKPLVILYSDPGTT